MPAVLPAVTPSGASSTTRQSAGSSPEKHWAQLARPDGTEGLRLTQTGGRHQENIRSRLGLLDPLVISQHHRVKQGEEAGVLHSLELVGGGGAAAGHGQGHLVPGQVVDQLTHS